MLVVFLLPWLIALLIPDVRTQLRLQVDGLLSAQPFSYYSFSKNSPVGLPWYRLQAKPLDVIEAEHPGDVRVAFEVAAAQDAMPKRGVERARVYDGVLRRFPQATWLHAVRIRAIAKSFGDDRLGGIYENESEPRLAPPTKLKTQLSFSSGELQQCITMARKGRTAEPGNSFYDWWLAHFLYAAYRDDEALAVLHEGSLKPYYDDHMREELQARIFSESQKRPQTAESKISIIASQFCPQYSPMRHFCRLLAWRCNGARASGQHQQVLRILADVTRHNGLMRRHGYFALDSLVAAENCQAIWRGVTPELTDAEKAATRIAAPRKNSRLLRLSAAALAYARAAGDLETASLISREAREASVTKARMTAEQQADVIFGLRKDLQKPSTALWLGCEILLYQMVLLVTLSCLMVLAARWIGSEATVANHDVQRTTIGCCMLFIATVAGMYYGNTGWVEFLSFAGPFTPVTLGAAETIGILCGLAGIWIPAVLPALAAIFVMRRRRLRPEHRISLEMLARRWLLALPARLKAACQLRVWPGPPWGDRFIEVILQLFLWVLRLATGVTVALLVWCWLYLFDLEPHYADDIWSYLIFEMSVWCLIWLTRARWWQKLRAHRAEVRNVLQWYHRSLISYLLLTGWLYLSLSLINIGPRRAATVEVDRYVRLGDAAFRRSIQNVQER